MVSKLLAASYFLVMFIPAALPQHRPAPVHDRHPQIHDRSPHRHKDDANRSSSHAPSMNL